MHSLKQVPSRRGLYHRHPSVNLCNTNYPNKAKDPNVPNKPFITGCVSKCKSLNL